jgi:hypothetical protein
MMFNLSTGGSHDQEYDREYDTRMSSTREVGARDRDQLGDSQEYRPEVFTPSRVGSHASSEAQSSLEARPF